MESFGCRSVEAFRSRYTNDLTYRLEEGQLGREAFWTDSLAVGSEPFIQDVSKTLKNRRRILYESVDHDPAIRLLKESNELPYGSKNVNPIQGS